jgi:hypothetical protein
MSAGNNDLMQCDEKWTSGGFLAKKWGSRVLVCLQDEFYVPGLNLNLLSITQKKLKTKCYLQSITKQFIHCQKIFFNHLISGGSLSVSHKGQTPARVVLWD